MEQSLKRQFDELKQKHPDAVLLFRCDDFYEAFGNDAEECARILGIIVTDREGIRVSAFPHHALDIYLPKLVRAGKRVAICDMLERPDSAKRSSKATKISLPPLTRRQYELLCECIRYRSADNSRERVEAVARGTSASWYNDVENRINELKRLIYDISIK